MSGKTQTYYKRKDAGLCVWCGKPKDDLGTKVLCSECKTVQIEKNKTRRHKYLKMNKCVQCGRETVPNNNFCTKHYFQNVSWSAFGTTKYWVDIQKKWDQQKGRCAYTDEILILGVNASLDHILPRSKYPEVKDSIDNIQWISTKMNIIKNDMTESEMERLFKRVLIALEDKKREFKPD